MERVVSVATATSTADSTPAGGGFAREPHVFRELIAEKVAVGPHDGIGKGRTFPRSNMGATGAQ